MTAAIYTLSQAAPECVAVELTPEQAAALSSAALAMAVSFFAAADRAELAGDFERADRLRLDGVCLSRAELAVRNAAR